MKKPCITIPIGDPAGIGPEIVVKALLNKEIQQTVDCLVIGDETIVQKAIEITHSPLKINLINVESPTKQTQTAQPQTTQTTDPQTQSKQTPATKPQTIQLQPTQLYTTQSLTALKTGCINLLPINNIDISRFEYGKIDGMCGKAAYEYIAKSIELAMNHVVSAVVTPPINKEALKKGGVNFIGHTEIFGSLTGTKDPLTMFEVHGMRIFFLTRHVSLRDACNMIKKERIKDYVRRCTDMLKTLGVTEGTMAIAGLNPHSGEHGLFGNEEVLEIEPAVAELIEEGYNVVGPIGADSVFHMALTGRFNSVLSLYHDQGHIAAKTLDFEKTIAVTGGMPILRTSVDHGTAMDIAGRGIASEISMIEAILLGAKYAAAFSS